MSNKKFHFLSGLPRTGSTVIESMLNQNPAVYVTPTSPLLHLLNANQDEFHKCPEVIANPFPEQLTNMSRGMINSAWEHRSEEIIIDKHRGWGKNMSASSTIFGYDVKILLTTRDLPSIMASWLTLIRNQPDNFIKRAVEEKGFVADESNMMAEMWYGHVLDCVESVAMARKTASDRLLEVNYDDFIADPKKAILAIEKFLDLPPFEYDFDNISNDNASNDLDAFGFVDLHKVRPKLEKVSKDPREILGDELYNRFVELEKQYL